MASLKGSEFYGEVYPKAEPIGMIGYLYRLADKSFAIVKKQQYTGAVIEISPVAGGSIRRFGAMNLGYSVVNYYTFKPA